MSDSDFSEDDERPRRTLSSSVPPPPSTPFVPPPPSTISFSESGTYSDRDDLSEANTDPDVGRAGGPDAAMPRTPGADSDDSGNFSVRALIASMRYMSRPKP